MNSDAYKEVYRDLASSYDRRWNSFSEQQYQWIINDLHKRFDQSFPFTLLDAGCGTGQFLSLVAKNFPNASLSGIDGTGAMIEQARAKLPSSVKLFHQDLNYALPQDTYNVIISTVVLHHLANAQAHLREFYRYLSTNGVCYLSEFAIDTWPFRLANKYWKWRKPEHIQAWSSKQLEHIITTSGFMIDRKEILQPDWFWRLQIYALAR